VKLLPLVNLTLEVEMNCKQCKFWLEYEPTQNIDDGVTFGSCRRFPPVLFLFDELNGNEYSQPSTCSDEWCGEGKIARIF
jgi:hypothetical protein